MPLPALYSDLAPWFHLLTAPSDYAEEAAFTLDLLQRHVDGPLETLLELGSGGGNTASHLKRHVLMTLSDLSPEMLDLSKTINPGIEHIVGDMRTLRLGRAFDAVFIHDAISYLTTESDLRLAFETAFIHLRPGGAAVFAPDFVTEAFQEGTDDGGHDGDDGRALRYLEWRTDPNPADTEYVTDFAILLRHADGTVESRYDHHVEGLFPRARWLDLMTQAGFQARDLDFQGADVEDPWGRVQFVGKRPA
ncbi:MAG TPA: class I SAM-dependent methyltransferase [Candidatus Limnocylindrales bacterium]